MKGLAAKERKERKDQMLTRRSRTHFEPQTLNFELAAPAANAADKIRSPGVKKAILQSH
jgi:hypothetical protein